MSPYKIGGKFPLNGEEFAIRAYDYTLNPNQNSLKRILDNARSYEETPPLLGMFNDIPWYQFREDEAQIWAKTGFSFIVNDAEHCQREGWYGKDQNRSLSRLGLLPVQRLPREALSSHGDAYQLGARATMKPYGTTFEEAKNYFECINFPTPGKATVHNRGAYIRRLNDRTTTFTPESLLEAETETQGWIQFETAEYILNLELRNQILDLMQAQGKNKTCGFVGPFDLVLREGNIPNLEESIYDLFKTAAKREIHMGRVVGSGSLNDPQKIEETMVRTIEMGARLIALHYLTSDMAEYGARNVSEPFFRATERCGF